MKTKIQVMQLLGKDTRDYRQLKVLFIFREEKEGRKRGRETSMCER